MKTTENLLWAFFKIRAPAGMSLVILLLISSTCNAQLHREPNPISPAREKSLLLNLKRDIPANQRLQVLLDLGNLYYNKPVRSVDNFEKGLKRAAEAIDLSRKLGNESAFNAAQYIKASILMLKEDTTGVDEVLKVVNDSTKIKTQLAFAEWYLSSSNASFAQSIAAQEKYVKLATILSLKTADKLDDITCHAHQGFVYIYKGDAKRAELFLNEALVQYQANSYKKLGQVYYFLQAANSYSGNYDKALFYSLETIKMVEKGEDTLSAGDYYYAQAEIYGHLDKKVQAVEAAMKAIQYYKYHASQYNIFDAVGFACRILIRLHKSQQALTLLQTTVKEFQPVTYYDKLLVIQLYGEVYLALKRFDEAEKYYLLSFKTTQEGNAQGLGAYKNLGYFYIEVANYEKAKPYLDKALDYLKVESADMKVKVHLHFMAFLADSATGNYLSAIKHLRINNRYDDTLFRASKAEASERLLVQYETAKKESQILLLNQTQKLQAANLNRAQVSRNLTICGIIVALTIAALFFRQNRLKNKSSRIISQKNELLQHLVSEKEWLLKEVHHRVKNNLHTVICLLESQAAYLENDALKAVENSQHRIFAMSLIHQKLYQSDDIKSIDMCEYITELAQYLEDGFGSSDQVQFELNIEHIFLNISQAIPLGLIINEAVTNSIKYAFPGEIPGKIWIYFKEQDRNLTMEIGDNGIGIPESLYKSELNSLGLELIKGLSKDIKGQIHFEVNRGTRIIVDFRRNDLHQHESKTIAVTANNPQI